MKDYIDDPTFDPENPEDPEVYARRDAAHWQGAAERLASMLVQREHEVQRLGGIIKRMDALTRFCKKSRENATRHVVCLMDRISDLHDTTKEQRKTIDERDAEIAELRKASSKPEWTTEAPTELGFYWLRRYGLESVPSVVEVFSRGGVLTSRSICGAYCRVEYLDKAHWCLITPPESEVTP